jgi:hypothetical protein
MVVGKLNKESLMAYKITLEDERGKQIEVLFDREGYLEILIIRSTSVENILDSTRLLDYVDFYGDTTFNVLQMKRLEIELEELRSFVETAEEHEFISSIQVLIKRAQQDGHLYLKIWGD